MIFFLFAGYWVDKREVGSMSWQRVNPTLCVPNQLNCANLIEGRQYEFRVIAQNEAGLSPPSTNSQQVKVVDPKGKLSHEINPFYIFFYSLSVPSVGLKIAYISNTD